MKYRNISCLIFAVVWIVLGVVLLFLENYFFGIPVFISGMLNLYFEKLCA